MSLASRQLDLVMGVDRHILVGPTGPTPFLCAYVGVVLDLLGVAASLISNELCSGGLVLLGGVPATTCGTRVCGVHCPPGPFVTPASGDAWLYFGARDVAFGGALAVRGGDLAFSCGEPRQPSSCVVPISAGPAVVTIPRPAALDPAALVADNLARRAQSAAAGAAGSAARGAASETVEPLLARLREKAGQVPQGLERWAAAALDRVRSRYPDAAAFFTGHPVDVATGRLVTRHCDLELPVEGAVGFARRYDSSWSHRRGALGYGWSHPYEQQVAREPHAFVFRGEDGREIEFPCELGASWDAGELAHPVEGSKLVPSPGGAVVIDARGGERHFERVPGQAHRARLVRIVSPRGREQRLGYDERGRLREVTDAGGRAVRFHYGEGGLLSRVSLSDGRGAAQPLVVLRHSGDGDLAGVEDALGQSHGYEYVGHLLVVERDPRGHRFYFRYDGVDSSARCVRTWGDGGALDRQIHYAPGRTVVVDSLDHAWVYELNRHLQVVALVDPLGGRQRFEYDPDSGAPLRHVDATGVAVPLEPAAAPGADWASDPSGATRVAERDSFGRVLALRLPGAGVCRCRRDPLGRVVEIRPPGTLAVHLSYDASGNLVEVRQGAAWQRYRYGPLGLLTEAESGRGQLRLRYDSELRLSCVTDELGRRHRIERDARGLPWREVGFSGVERRVRRDAAGRVAEEIRGESVHERRAYDEHGRLARVEYGDGTWARFVRDRRGCLVEAENAWGKVSLSRDGQGRLVGEETPAGAWSAELDSRGRLVALRSSRGLEQRFERRDGERRLEASMPRLVPALDSDESAPPAGKQSAIQAPGPLGGGGPPPPRARAVPSGARQSGGFAAVPRSSFSLLQRLDAGGRELLRRLPGQVSLRSAYDEAGRLHRQLLAARGGRPWEARFDFDGLGCLQRARFLGAQSDRRYQRGPAGELEAVECGGERAVRAVDPVGNAFATDARSDRGYGPGGRLLWARTPRGLVRYEYDRLGRRVGARREGGERWRYGYDDAGQLVELCPPSGEPIRYRYDALGRCVSRTCGARARRTVWWQDVPLHEWTEGVPPREGEIDAARRRAETENRPFCGPLGEVGDEPDELVTWIYDPDQPFAPLARHAGGQWLAHLAQPFGGGAILVEAGGGLRGATWLDLHGRCTASSGPAWLQPHRFLGQREEPETGLHQSRFRHYDPDAGVFLTPDPAGLWGGLRPYAYPEDPTRLADPLGLCECGLSAEIVGALGAVRSQADSLFLKEKEEAAEYLQARVVELVVGRSVPPIAQWLRELADGE